MHSHAERVERGKNQLHRLKLLKYSHAAHENQKTDRLKPMPLNQPTH